MKRTQLPWFSILFQHRLVLSSCQGVYCWECVALNLYMILLGSACWCILSRRRQKSTRSRLFYWQGACLVHIYIVHHHCCSASHLFPVKVVGAVGILSFISFVIPFYPRHELCLFSLSLSLFRCILMLILDSKCL